MNLRTQKLSTVSSNSDSRKYYHRTKLSGWPRPVSHLLLAKLLLFSKCHMPVEQPVKKSKGIVPNIPVPSRIPIIFPCELGKFYQQRTHRHHDHGKWKFGSDREKKTLRNRPADWRIPTEPYQLQAVKLKKDPIRSANLHLISTK